MHAGWRASVLIRRSPRLLSGGTVTVFNFTSSGPNELGLAWVKDATYLPDVRNEDGWLSTLYIRNDGAVMRGVPGETEQVRISYHSLTGTPANPSHPYDECRLPPNAFCVIRVNELNRIPIGTSGSAIVSGGEDISVLIINAASTKAYAYEGIPANGERSGIGVGLELFIPSYRRGLYGYDSTFFMQNPNATSTTVTAYFHDDAGNQVGSDARTIVPGGQRSLMLAGAASGSVRLVATAPVAVVVRHEEANKIMAYPALTGGGEHGWLPSLFKGYANTVSSYQLQATRASSVAGYVDYVPGGGRPFTLNPRGHREQPLATESLPSPSLVAAEMSVTGGAGEVAFAIHHTDSSRNAAMGYSGFTTGAREVLRACVMISNDHHTVQEKAISIKD